MTENIFKITHGFLHFPEELKQFEGRLVYYSKDGKLKEGDRCIGTIEDVHLEGNAIRGKIILNEGEE